MNLRLELKRSLLTAPPIGGTKRLCDTKVKKLQKDYELALWIRQNTIKKFNPTRKEVEVAVYAMKNHNVQPDDPAKQHQYGPPDESFWCTWWQDKATATSTYVCLRSFLNNAKSQ